MLALTTFTRSLAEATSGDLTAISVHPGVFDTEQVRTNEDAGQAVSDTAAILAMFGAQETTAVNGGYYEGRHPARAAALVDHARARRRLAILSKRLVQAP